MLCYLGTRESAFYDNSNSVLCAVGDTDKELQLDWVIQDLYKSVLSTANVKKGDILWSLRLNTHIFLELY